MLTLLEEAQRIAHVGSWEINHRTQVLRWSQEMFRLYGMDPQAKTPSPDVFADTIHVDDRDLTRERFVRAAAEKSELDFQHRVIQLNGATANIRVQGRFVYDDQGGILRSVGCAQDITAQVRAESELRESQVFLARTGASAGVGGWEYDLQNKKLTWARETSHILEYPSGFSPASIEEAFLCYTDASKPIIIGAIQGCIDHAQAFDLELEVISATGRALGIRMTGIPELNNGKVTRIIGSCQDITKRRAMERELAASYEMVRVTLESIGDAVITTNPQGKIVWLNTVAEVMTGWSAGQAEGLPLTDVFHIVNADTRRVARNPVVKCLRVVKRVGCQPDTLLLSRQGTEYPIEESASPMRNENGEILGAVLVFRDVTEQRRLSRELTHRATHDALTGLFNRSEFEQRVSHCLAKVALDNSSHVLLYVDLDEFKIVNDAAGHAAGDELLRHVGAVLRSQIREHDTVARLGGDEFGIILKQCTLEEGQAVAKAICEHMAAFRFAYETKRHRIGVSIGVVPVDSRWRNLTALLQASDSSCYAAKEAGRNRVHTYLDTDRMIQAQQTAMKWVNRLEAAMDENRFVLYAQHIKHIGGVDGGLHCEVLLRLREPDGSLTLPGTFFPAAERFHMASRIDRWVLTSVLDQLMAPDVAHDQIETIAVNLSGQSIGDHSFHQDIFRLLRDTPFDVRKLCFEITETAAITNLSEARLFIDVIRKLGIRVSLDDFGAGASSFGYLRSLPVDLLKIDGQFITGLLDDPLNSVAIRCFRDVSNVFGVSTIAECVESIDVWDELARIGIDMAQGFLIHLPEKLSAVLPRVAVVTLAHRTDFLPQTVT